MGRSVSYLSSSMHEVYVDVSDFDESGMDWDDWESNITCELINAFPSLRNTQEWDGRETRIFLFNGHCEIGISEYCGLASVSIRVRPDIETESLAENWIDQNWNKIEKVVQDYSGKNNVYIKQGSFSNGEGVFHRKGSEEGFCHNGFGKTYEF